jgi:hypothetical protein
VWNSAGVLVADSVSAFFDRHKPKPAPTTNEMLHQANLKAQHEEMRRFVEPHRPPVDWDALAAGKKERESRPPTVSECIQQLHLHGKLFGGR